MKKRNLFETNSGSTKAILDDRVLSKFPKFLELTEEEKTAFYEILKAAREKVDKKKKVGGEAPKNTSTISDHRTSDNKRLDALTEDVRNSKGFQTLSEAEKKIYFDTLEKASAKTTRRKNSSLTELRDKNIFNVAVNLISKDNERIRKTEKERKNHKKTMRSEKEKFEEEEDLLLLNIVGKSPEDGVSTKRVSSESENDLTRSSTNLTEGFSSAQYLKRSVSFIDPGRKLSTSSGKSTTLSGAKEMAKQMILPPEFERKGSKEKKEVDEFFEAGAELEKERNEISDKLSSGSMIKEIEETRTAKELSDKESEAKPTLFSQLENLEIKEPEITSGAVDELEPESMFQGKAESEENLEPNFEKAESLETFPGETEELGLKEENFESGQDLTKSGRESIAEEEERKSELSLLDSEASKISGEWSEEAEEEECVPIYDKKLTAPKSRVRTLQDLLRDRAVLVIDSSDRFKIEWLPKDKIPKMMEMKEISLPDFDVHDEEEAKKEKKKNKVVFFLEKMFACGRKETEKEDAVAENLKGESVSVEMGTRQRNAASATLDDATIQVLEAAKRKRIIARYTKQN